jgi:hypothetical protein
MRYCLSQPQIPYQIVEIFLKLTWAVPKRRFWLQQEKCYAYTMV